MSSLLLDSSIIVSAVLERGLSRTAERAIKASNALIVSRLAQVETNRALYRAHADERLNDQALARAQDQVSELFARCEFWEVSRMVCDSAAVLAPSSGLRTLDAIHLATFLAARRRIPALRLLTSDQRMRDAAVSLGIRLVIG